MQSSSLDDDRQSSASESRPSSPDNDKGWARPPHISEENDRAFFENQDAPAGYIGHEESGRGRNVQNSPKDDVAHSGLSSPLSAMSPFPSSSPSSPCVPTITISPPATGISSPIHNNSSTMSPRNTTNILPNVPLPSAIFPANPSANVSANTENDVNQDPMPPELLHNIIHASLSSLYFTPVTPGQPNDYARTALHLVIAYPPLFHHIWRLVWSHFVRAATGHGVIEDTYRRVKARGWTGGMVCDTGASEAELRLARLFGGQPAIERIERRKDAQARYEIVSDAVEMLRLWKEKGTRGVFEEEEGWQDDESADEEDEEMQDAEGENEEAGGSGEDGEAAPKGDFWWQNVDWTVGKVKLEAFGFNDR